MTELPQPHPFGYAQDRGGRANQTSLQWTSAFVKTSARQDDATSQKHNMKYP